MKLNNIEIRPHSSPIIVLQIIFIPIITLFIYIMIKNNSYNLIVASLELGVIDLGLIIFFKNVIKFINPLFVFNNFSNNKWNKTTIKIYAYYYIDYY